MNLFLTDIFFPLYERQFIDLSPRRWKKQCYSRIRSVVFGWSNLCDLYDYIRVRVGNNMDGSFHSFQIIEQASTRS